MKHFSFLKLIVALLICNVYVFCCAVTGTVHGERIDDSPPTSEPTSVNPNKHGGTVDFIGDDTTSGSGSTSIDNNTSGGTSTSQVAIENLGFARPGLAEKPITSSYRPTSSVLELTQKPVSSSSEETSSEPEQSTTSSSSEPEPVESSTPEPDESSTPDPEPPESSNSTPEESSSSSSEETSKPQDVPPDIDPNAEILRVKNGTKEVSGSALDIVTQIVENEIGSTFAPEAIKAQAVTAYTYVKYSNLHGIAPYCILRESTNDSVRTLVKSVLGEGIYYEGELIQAVYSASSAGYTASSKNTWGGNIPYLQSVYCELDEKYDPNYGRKATFSAGEMKSRIYEKANINLTGDPSTWFVIENRTEGKYVGDMKIGGQDYFVDKDGDTLRATGRRFREIIMEFDIRSSAFDIDFDPNTQEFTITTYGYGHGVGLSQNGANNLARYWGWDYKKILTFYFQGTEVY